MLITDAITARRSIKRFTDRAVTREEIETLLQAAVHAPNHHLTQPWRFYVLGPEARHAYGLALGDRKARKIENAEAAQAMREKVAHEHRALPAMIAVAVVHTDNAEIREEDYAAAMMGIQNLSLAALSLGLGSNIKTGAVMSDPVARAATGVADTERIIALVSVGEPAEAMPRSTRRAASELTTWLP
jgi:nitroreductase